jgi:hypothetical protein
MSYITITDRDDGFGAQLQHILFGLLYAEAHGFTYIHKPISAMEHNYSWDSGFIDKIENFLGLRDHYLSVGQVDRYDVVSFWQLYNFVCADFSRLFLESRAIYLYKQVFWKNKTRSYNKDSGSSKKYIAVHIRRPNICDTRIEGADTPNSYYLDKINMIRELYDGDTEFHIYSQGPIEMFSCFCHKDIVLHLDIDLCLTFLGLVSADVLVTSKSALSYSAAMLTDGIVYFIGLGPLNPRSDSWILCG